ncbi:FAD-dependent oxidoreductase [Synechococcus sp. W4D4]|uniref:FAD-dependent oxidoreductase n=1 Tax=Synechococcus sp. W4D4 TaxID=3392294 RepID=UPI0039EA351E
MPAHIESAPVVVWGGGTGGVSAAIQSARSGAATILLTPGAWLGGMVSAAGVCCPDGNELSPWQTGLWGAFLRGMADAEPGGLDQNWVSCFGFRPAQAEDLLQRWVQALPNLSWLAGSRALAVHRSERLIRSIEVEQAGVRQELACSVLIDGSDRGDLLPLLGLPFRFGWEAQEVWNEPSAPSARRMASEPFFRKQPVQSPTWVVMGQLSADEPPPGLPEKPRLSAPFEQACQSFGLAKTLTYGRLPGGLVMLNWPLDGNDWHQDLARAFSAERAAESDLYREMQDHTSSFAAELREASHGWLELGDAFPRNSGSPAPWFAAMPYWREGRRIRGRNTVIEQDLLPQHSGRSIAELPRDDKGQVNSIAVGNYANDHHYPGGDWPLAPKSCRWGGRWSGTPFCVPYGALLSADLDNFLAADKAFSTSHMANGATRLQPLIFNLGQAAGAAAALSVEMGKPPAELPVLALQERLIRDPMAPAGVVPLWDTAWNHPDWAQRQRAVLQAPELLSQTGLWQGAASGRSVGAAQGASALDRAQQRLQGSLVPIEDGTYAFDLARPMLGSRRWPVITLEPAVDTWLAKLDCAKNVELMGCFNPWGPWLRVSAVANQASEG